MRIFETPFRYKAIVFPYSVNHWFLAAPLGGVASRISHSASIDYKAGALADQRSLVSDLLYIVHKAADQPL